MSVGRTRVLQVITGLELGGAEIVLERLLARAGGEVETSVISLTGRGRLAERIEAHGVPVLALDGSNPPGPLALRRLALAIEAANPEVVQTWLLHANVLAGSIARMQRRSVCWSMHMTEAERDTHGRATVALQRLEAKLSRRVPARVVSCSQSTFELMAHDGYAMSRAEVVPNGFDLDLLRPDTGARESLRHQLGIDEDAPVVAHAARLHPMKDHRTLLEAAAIVRDRVPDVRFVLCGGGVSNDSPELAGWAKPLGDTVMLLGPRDDVTRLWQAADVAALSSATGEALPLVLGEAMACGTPAVSTDVGDSARVVGDTGRIVPPRDPRALADGLVELLLMSPAERAELGRSARERIGSRYSLTAMVAGYERVWAELAESARTA